MISAYPDSSSFVMFLDVCIFRCLPRLRSNMTICLPLMKKSTSRTFQHVNSRTAQLILSYMRDQWTLIHEFGGRFLHNSRSRLHPYHSLSIRHSEKSYRFQNHHHI